AWVEIQAAAAQMRSSEVPKLAGLIELHRREIDIARKNLEDARRLNPGDCETLYYLVAALMEQSAWADGSSVATAAVSCLDREEAALRRDIDRLRAADIAEDRRDRYVKRREQQIVVDIRRRTQSWFNAAVAQFNLGQHEQARRSAEQISGDEEFGE